MPILVMAGSPIAHHLLDEPYPTLPVLPILVNMKTKGGSEYTIETTAKVAKTLQEVMELIEQGFQFVLEMEGLRYFKKRK